MKLKNITFIRKILVNMNVYFRHIDNASPSKHRSTNSLRHRNGERSNSFPINDLIRNKSKDHCSSYLFICSIRIGFGFLLVLLIVLCLITIILYGVDMLTQSCCRLVHHNQPFLISFITGNKNKSLMKFLNKSISFLYIRSFSPFNRWF
jgi:hypothetical protein